MMFFEKVGKMALGSRLRMISEMVTKDALKIYELYGVELKPKWFPVFYCLSQDNNSRSITSIANEIGQSHPSVVKIVQEMSKFRLITEKKDRLDGRKNNIKLTKKGINLSAQIQDQYIDVNKSVENMLEKTRHNIWFAIEELEFLLNEMSLYSRVLEQKKLRESKKIEIVDYNLKYRELFKKLNEDWITSYFKMEEEDKKSLENPEEYILNQGGKILVALYNGIPLGVCALLKMTDRPYTYELAKMAVSPKEQGKGIGFLLGNAIIDKAKSLGASKIYLESNTILKPAIFLYQKLGFKKILGRFTPYERCNIQMELRLK